MEKKDTRNDGYFSEWPTILVNSLHHSNINFFFFFKLVILCLKDQFLLLQIGNSVPKRSCPLFDPGAPINVINAQIPCYLRRASDFTGPGNAFICCCSGPGTIELVIRHCPEDEKQ